MLRWLALVVFIFVLGCKGSQSQIVGTWKAEPVKPIASGNLQDVARATTLGLVTQNLSIEFNGDGKFKVGAGIAWGNGTYEWKGDELELKFDTYAPQTPLKFKLDGGKLVQVTEFASDAKIVLDKQG